MNKRIFIACDTNKISTVKKIIKAHHGTDDNWQQYVDSSVIRLGQDVRYALNDRKLKNLGWKPKKNHNKEIKNIVQEIRLMMTRWDNDS